MPSGRPLAACADGGASYDLSTRPWCMSQGASGRLRQCSAPAPFDAHTHVHALTHTHTHAYTHAHTRAHTHTQLTQIHTPAQQHSHWPPLAAWGAPSQRRRARMAGRLRDGHPRHAGGRWGGQRRPSGRPRCGTAPPHLLQPLCALQVKQQQQKHQRCLNVAYKGWGAGQVFSASMHAGNVPCKSRSSVRYCSSNKCQKGTTLVVQGYYP